VSTHTGPWRGGRQTRPTHRVPVEGNKKHQHMHGYCYISSHGKNAGTGARELLLMWRGISETKLQAAPLDETLDAAMIKVEAEITQLAESSVAGIARTKNYMRGVGSTAGGDTADFDAR
jgi:hypothetical protein